MLLLSAPSTFAAEKEKQIMKQLLLVLFLTLTPAAYLTAATVKGWVKDAQTGEELIGAAVYVKEIRRWERQPGWTGHSS